MPQHALEAAFRAGLFDTTAPVPAGVVSRLAATPPRRRYAVYRGTVMTSLVEALRSRFPATLRIVGEDCFAAMAGRFIVAEPPRSPVLLEYGEGFPDFVTTLEAELGLPYLADVLRLEIAWTQAFHAADADAATAADLAALDPATLADTRVLLHPAVRLVGSGYPVVTLWSMNVAGGEPRPIEDWCGEAALVTRPRLDVAVHRLPPGGLAFLSGLGAGEPLGAAVEAAFAAAESFDPAQALAGLVAAGVAAAFRP